MTNYDIVILDDGPVTINLGVDPMNKVELRQLINDLIDTYTKMED